MSGYDRRQFLGLGAGLGAMLALAPAAAGLGVRSIAPLKKSLKFGMVGLDGSLEGAGIDGGDIVFCQGVGEGFDLVPAFRVDMNARRQSHDDAAGVPVGLAVADDKKAGHRLDWPPESGVWRVCTIAVEARGPWPEACTVQRGLWCIPVRLIGN